MEVAVFLRLEEKIEALLDRLTSLKLENSELKTRIEEHDDEVAELKRAVASMEAEREQVRQRIEKLVAKLEQA